MERERRGPAPVWVIVPILVGLVSSSAGCGPEVEDPGDVPSMLKGVEVSKDSGAGRDRAPVVRAISFEPARPTPGRMVRARAKATDPDGDDLTVDYRWLDSRGRVIGQGDSLDTRGLAAGDRVRVVVIASDGSSESAEAVQELRMSAGVLQISSVVIRNAEGARPGAVLEAGVETTDPGSFEDGVSLEWLVNDLVVSRDEDELDTSSFLPGDRVILRAKIDDPGRRTRAVNSRVLVLSRGIAPEILSEPVEGLAGGVFRYHLRATSEQSGAKLSYELLRGPEGMRMDPQSGLVEWRPGPSQRGDVAVEIAVVDQWGSGVTQSFKIEAEEPGALPASRR